jgi:Domain of unknown function (DUF222)/HNH endonuclease
MSVTVDSGITKLGISETLVAVRVLLAGLMSELPRRTVSAGDVVVSRALVDMSELFCTHMVARYADDGCHVDDGFPTMSAFLAEKARVRKSEGNNRVRRMSVLNVLGLFHEAAIVGDITSSHVELIASAVTQPRVMLALRDQQVLLDWACHLDASGFATIVHKWVSLCDDELSDPTTDDVQQDLRRVQIRQTLNGMWALNGLLDPETGQAVEAAIEAALAKRVCDEDERTFAQRRHDALGDIARSSLSAETRTGGAGQRAQISLIINHTDGTAHTPNQYYVSSFTRDMMLCDSVITAIKCCDGVPFDVGTPETDIPTRNRKAVIARDRCCRYPGCDRPAHWSDIHHIRERHNGGTHEIGNLVLMCRFHHRFIHKHRLRLVWADDQITLLVTTANGNQLRSRPHPATAHSLAHPPGAAPPGPDPTNN